MNDVELTFHPPRHVNDVELTFPMFYCNDWHRSNGKGYMKLCYKLGTSITHRLGRAQNPKQPNYLVRVLTCFDQLLFKRLQAWTRFFLTCPNEGIIHMPVRMPYAPHIALTYISLPIVASWKSLNISWENVAETLHRGDP